MSPIAVHSTFTREFLDDPESSHAENIDKMCRAFDRAAFQKDYIIVEGTDTQASAQSSICPTPTSPNT